jgi:hypothetical protein
MNSICSTNPMRLRSAMRDAIQSTGAGESENTRVGRPTAELSKFAHHRVFCVSPSALFKIKWMASSTGVLLKPKRNSEGTGAPEKDTYTTCFRPPTITSLKNSRPPWNRCFDGELNILVKEMGPSRLQETFLSWIQTSSTIYWENRTLKR